MKNECSIIRDLLPLYIEGLVSEDTAAFVREHIEKCEKCRAELEQQKEPDTVRAAESGALLLSIRRKLRAKRIQTIMFTAICVAAFLVSLFAVLDAPEFLPYSSELVYISENPNKSISITFNEVVTDFSCNYTPASDDYPGYYTVEAWNSQWDRWFSNRGEQTVTISPIDDLLPTVYYASNNGEADVCIYGSSLAENVGMISLPRLALGYYLLLDVLCLGVLSALVIAVRRKASIRIWIERILLYPVSYLLGHFIVLGFSTVSYSMLRDFSLIIFISILLYFGLLLLHNFYLLRKEMKDVNGKSPMM